MKTIACFWLLLLNIANASVEVARAEVTPAALNSAVTERRLTNLIDPEKGTYGIPFGISEYDFIAQHGKPTASLLSGAAETTLVYGREHAFLFEQGKLVGVHIGRNAIGWSLSNLTPRTNQFDALRWRLSNGIQRGMNVADVEKILGHAVGLTGQHRLGFGTTTVSIDFVREAKRGDEESRIVSGLLVRQKALQDDIYAARNPYGGLGIVVRQGDGDPFPSVNSVVPAGAADKAGVRTGMLIIAVDGADLAKKPLVESVQLLRGEPGSTVRLTVQEPGTLRTNEVAVTRMPIRFHDH